MLQVWVVVSKKKNTEAGDMVYPNFVDLFRQGLFDLVAAMEVISLLCDSRTSVSEWV